MRSFAQNRLPGLPENNYIANVLHWLADFAQAEDILDLEENKLKCQRPVW
jgi:hypothetical protein